MAIACAAPISEKPPAAIQPSTPAQPAPSLTPPSPSQTETVSLIDVKQYTGIPSVDCKTPVTDTASLPAPDYKITVDTSKVVSSLNHELWANIGYDSVYSSTTTEVAQPFWELIRQTRAVRYVRCHNYFSDGMFVNSLRLVKQLLKDGYLLPDNEGNRFDNFDYWSCRIYSEDDRGNPQYNFWHVDHVLDVFISAGVKPMIETIFMPDALADGAKIRNYGGGLINVPKDHNKWRELVYRTVKHCIERYGVEEVRSWYWEAWNEPDLRMYFIDGDTNNYKRLYELYDYFADGAKAADEKIKVGGPGFAFRSEWLSAFLAHCASGANYATSKMGAPLDFIAWHCYGNITAQLEQDRQKLGIIGQFPSLNNCLKFKNEWGSHVGSGNINQPPLFTNWEAGFLSNYIDAILSSQGNKPDMILRWSVPTQGGENNRHLSYSYRGCLIAMPILNAFIMLTKMGDELVELSGTKYGDAVHGFASRTPNGTQVLLYNFNQADKENKGATQEIDLTLKGLSGSWSKMKRYQIDSNYSNAWSVSKMEPKLLPNLPPIKSMAELTAITDASKLKIIEQTDKLNSKDGQITLRLSMPANSVTLIAIGDEAVPPSITKSQHVSSLLAEEALYNEAKGKMNKGDLESAKVVFEKLAKDSFAAVTDKSSTNPYSFWGQKALFRLVDIELKRRDFIAADNVRKRLLTTTLSDVDRFTLLNERQKFLDAAGQKNSDEAKTIAKEIENVRMRLEYFANWDKWQMY